MRIALDIRPLQVVPVEKYRGVQVYVLRLARALLDMGGNKLTLFAWPGDNYRLDPEITASPGVRIVRVPRIANRFFIRNFGFVFDGLGSCGFYRRLAAESDIIHFTSPQEVFYGFPWRSIGVPRVLTVHDIMSVVCPDDVYYKLDPVRRCFSRTLHKMVLRTYRNADVLFCDSAFTRDELIRVDRTFAKIPAEVVLLGADCAVSENLGGLEEQCAEFRKKYNLPDDYFLYVGGLNGNKNVGLIFEALHRRGQGTVCLAGPYTDAERAAMSAAYPDVKAVWLGFFPNDEMPLLYRAAKCFVYASKMEGFGLPPLEAMANNTACLCSNAASLPEVCGDACLQFSPYDADALAGLMDRVCAEPELVSDLRKRGRQRAAGFSWKHCAERTMEAYSAAISSYKKAKS